MDSYETGNSLKRFLRMKGFDVVSCRRKTFGHGAKPSFDIFFEPRTSLTKDLYAQCNEIYAEVKTRTGGPSLVRTRENVEVGY